MKWKFLTILKFYYNKKFKIKIIKEKTLINNNFKFLTMKTMN